MIEHSGNLRLYNQFPRNYANIGVMTKQLAEIAAMGFNAVWVNPLYETGESKKKLCGLNNKNKHILSLSDSTQSGSLYAMKDNSLINSSFSEYLNLSADERKPLDIESLKKYTAEAANHGLTPIFDLVLKHVAIDSPLVAHPDTAHWFKRHPNGKLDIHGINENGIVTKAHPWDDVASFNYDDPIIAKK